MTPYHLNFVWRSAYGHVVKLLEGLGSEPGVVLDLGCGYGAVAEPLTELGFTYVGCDLDEQSVQDVRNRGFLAEVVDLTEPEVMAARIRSLLDGRTPKAILMLDVLEHLADTRSFLASLRELVELLDRPTLIVSMPNVAHFDLGAKLLTGRWEVTPTGLLDITHVQLFTEARLTDELAAFGWAQIGERDFHLPVSDQCFPSDDPTLAPDAPLSTFLRAVRNQRDANGSVNQFVRAYALTDNRKELADPRRSTEGPFLTVLVRTQGNRMPLLADALTCLAAQTDEDFEVLLTVHSDEVEAANRVTELVLTYDVPFAGRVNVVPVHGGDRARPLNVGLGLAVGRYITFLDDDDVVTGDWVETFHRGVGERGTHVVRARSAVREVCLGRPETLADWSAVGPLECPFDATFDFLTHLRLNQTPICSMALPVRALRAMGMHFDESLPVVEDWDLLMRLAPYTGVKDTGRVTSVYHHWQNTSQSQTSIDREIWGATHRALLARYDRAPLLLPPGSVHRLVHGRADPDSVDVAELRAELAAARDELNAIKSSEWWRATAPMRSGGTVAKRVVRQVRQRAVRP